MPGILSSAGGQPARFVFKLRRNIALEGDLLLAALELRALLGSDPTPIADLAAYSAQHPALQSLAASASPAAAVREAGTQGYSATAPLALLPDLIRKLAFIQHIYCLLPGDFSADELQAELRATVGPVVGLLRLDDGVALHAVPHAALLELADTALRRATGDPHRLLAALPVALLGEPPTAQAQHLADAALAAKSASAYLSHDIHYYKAKFFPRLARAALNYAAANAPAGPHLALDDFVGSGTTLLEAALLGIPSVGLDLDPLSVLVAQTKLDVLRMDSGQLAAASAAFADAARKAARNGAAGTAIDFPAWLLKNRKMNAGIAAQLNGELATVQPAIAAAPPELGNLLRVLLSDALSRKLRMRFLGTGVGRFSLTVRETPLADTVGRSLRRYVNVALLGEWLRETLHIDPAPATVLTADARAVPYPDGAFDILLTSPPYLPASSGRESYTRARALSLIALGLRDRMSVDELDADTIGSMQPPNADIAPSADEQALADWLAADELRAPKAAPTLRYFADMRRAFAEMARVLRPGATAIVVSGKQSTFYRFSTREALYVARSAELLADAASTSGFTVAHLHDLQLQKANRNARPRSLDDYYETLIVLKREETRGQGAGSRGQ